MGMHRGFSSMRWQTTGIAAGALVMGLAFSAGAVWVTWGFWVLAVPFFCMTWDFGRLARMDWVEQRVPGIPGPCHCRECAPELH